jgi:NADH dehydrogenase [ubiquinone] 1 alpha subcomplex assembly factor 7
MEWVETPMEEPVSPPPLPSADEGTVLEVAPGDAAALRSVGDCLVEGAWIALDFGAEEGDLASRGASGTLAAHRAHRFADPLSAPGVTDLSAWVDFTRLRAHAREAGWREAAYQSQTEALVDWGLPEVAERAATSAPDAAEGVRIRLAAKNLLFGFSTFRVLDWSAGASLGPAETDRPPAAR